MSNGNKHNNGVHEVGKLETLQAYQEDTPGQQVEKYLESIKEVIEEKKEKQKKSFMKVFQNPLKGFPYNEELDDNFVKPLEEAKRNAKYLELEFKNKNEAIKAYKHINNKLYPGGTQPFEDFVQEGKWLQFDNVQDVKDVLDVFKKGGLQFKISGGELKLGESLEEGKYAKYSDLLMKKAKEMQAIDKAQNRSGVASPSLNALKSINKEIEKEMKKLGITESINDELDEGKMGELFLDIQNGATAKDIARDYPVSIQQAKDFLKDYYSQKKGPRKEEVEETEEAFSTKQKSGKEIARKMLKIKSLFEAKKLKNLIPEFEKIVKTKGAAKVSGVMVDMFTASVIVKAYAKVNDKNKKRMETSDVYTLIKIAQKMMGLKEETVSEDYKKVIKMFPRDRDWKKLITKHKRAIDAFRNNNKDLPSDVEDELLAWAWDTSEVSGKHDAEDFIISILDEGKIKEEFGGKDGQWPDEETENAPTPTPIPVDEDGNPITEGTWALPKTSKQKKELKDLLKKPVILGKEGDDAADKLYDLIGDDGLFDDLYKAGQKNPKGDARPIIKAKMKELGIKEGKMDGSKLTGQEISVYFRRHKVRDKQVRKAVEFALDHGGAMTYAIKGIEKIKKGLSKNKDVVKALNYANYGTEQKIPEVGFMFKENSPIAGDIKLEGDQYIPQKKGVNKNIANYWNKEIKGLKPKELEAIQSMYMITDHSGVVQMYKAGKRDFIKSIKS